jgi:hypothetical protein
MVRWSGSDAKATGMKSGRPPKCTAHQKCEAIKSRDVDDETLRSIGRNYNVSTAHDFPAVAMVRELMLMDLEGPYPWQLCEIERSYRADQGCATAHAAMGHIF